MAGIAETFVTASFKGATFLWSSITEQGGRKNVVHEFPGSNKRFVEDLGLLPEVFTGTAIIEQGREGADYRSRRDALRAALKSEGPGPFVHPTIGEVLVSSGDFHMREHQTALGRAEFTLTFRRHDDIAPPVSAGISRNTVSNAVDEISEGIIEDIAAEFDVSSFIAANVLNARELLLSVTGRMRTILGVGTTALINASNLVNLPTQAFRQISSVLSSVSLDPVALGAFLTRAERYDGDVNVNLFDSDKLGADTAELLAEFENVPATPLDRVRAGNNLFDEAPGETDDTARTFAAIERDIFNATIRRAMQQGAWAMAVRAAADVDYGNTVELAGVERALESRFQEMLRIEEIELEQQDVLKTARNDLRSFLENVEVSLYRIGTVRTRQTGSLPLAFAYYNRDAEARSDDLLALNPDIRNAAFIPAGNVDILQQ